MLAEVEDVDRLAFDDLFREQKKRHVGPAPGPIYRKETQTRDRQPIEVRVGMRHQFVGFLARGIKVERMIDIVMDAERHPCVGTVH